MRKLSKFRILMLAALLIAALASCNKDDDDNGDDNNGGGGSAGTITATIDGEDVDFKSVDANKALGLIAFDGSEGVYSLSFLLPDDIATGTYDLNSSNLSYSAICEKGDDGYMASSGSITITKHNESTNKLEGTFDFTGSGAAGEITVSNGSFSLEYKEAK